MPSSQIMAMIKDRIEPLQAWLSTECGSAAVCDKHLDAGSPERVYWHVGYHAALKDVAALLAEKELRTENTSKPSPLVVPDAESSQAA
jgi:hypothetical protein